MATPTIREVVKAVSNGSTTVTTAAATTVGDLLVVFHQTAFRASSDLVTPTGTAGTWTSIVSADSATNTTIKLRAWRRYVTAGGAQTVTLAPAGGANTNSVIVLVLSGADQSTPIDGTPASATGASGTAHAVGPITTATPDALLLGSWGVYGTGAGGYTPPAGMTEQAETNLSANNAQAAATQALTASGSTGTRAATSAAAAAGWGAVLFAVQGPPPPAKSGSVLATVRLTASSAGGPAARSGSSSAALRLAAGTGGLSSTRARSLSAAARLTATADGGKATAGAPAATLKLTSTSTGTKVNIGRAVMVLSAAVKDVLHAGAGTPGTLPASGSLYPSESLYPSALLYPAGSPRVDPVRLSASTTQRSRATSNVAVSAVLLLQTSTTATSDRANSASAAPLFISAEANTQRVIVAIATQVLVRPAPTTTYELICVARVMQPSGSPVYLEVDPIDWTGLSFTEELSKVPQLNVGCQITGLTEAVLQRLRKPAELPTELWLRRNGQLVFSGPLVTAQVQGESLSLNAQGALGYLRLMVVGADLVFARVDQFAIVQKLIDQWQTLPYGHFGIDTAGVAPSGVARDATYLAKELHNVGQRVEELGLRENGFDLWVDPASRKLQLAYPTRGVDRSSGEDAIVFDERNIVSPNIMFSVAPGDVASEAFGTGTGNATIYSTKANTGLRSQYGRSGVTKTFDGVSEQTTLDDHVQGLLNARATALLVPGPDVRVTPDSDIASYDVGDTVSYTMHNLLSVAGAFRLRKRTVTVSKTGQETVSVGFV